MYLLTAVCMTALPDLAQQVPDPILPRWGGVSWECVNIKEGTPRVVSLPRRSRPVQIKTDLRSAGCDEGKRNGNPVQLTSCDGGGWVDGWPDGCTQMAGRLSRLAPLSWVCLKKEEKKGDRPAGNRTNQSYGLAWQVEAAVLCSK
jgi:hypothetical protein